VVEGLSFSRSLFLGPDSFTGACLGHYQLVERRRRGRLTGQDQAAVADEGGKGGQVVVLKQGRGGDILEVGLDGAGRQDIVSPGRPAEQFLLGVLR
jgi:hypothetical protein